jgi:hypothetical protein
LPARHPAPTPRSRWCDSTHLAAFIDQPDRLVAGPERVRHHLRRPHHTDR